jgi:thioredoxin 1
MQYSMEDKIKMTIEINNDNFSEEVEKSKTPVIIDFYADWCMPCQMLKPVFEKVSKNYEGKLKFAKLNTEVAPNIAQKFMVQGIPCLVIVEKSKEIGRIVGFCNESALKQKIDMIISGK